MEEQEQKKSKVSLKEIFNGNIWTREFIRKQYGLFILIALLFFIYINNGYRSEKQQAKIVALNNELNDLKFRYLTLSSELEQMTRESAVAKQLSDRSSNVQVAVTPSVKIKK